MQIKIKNAPNNTLIHYDLALISPTLHSLAINKVCRRWSLHCRWRSPILLRRGHSIVSQDRTGEWRGARWLSVNGGILDRRKRNGYGFLETRCAWWLAVNGGTGSTEENGGTVR
ncbi:DUF3575 domain-containing protein [Sesbania bispinosa]|nr:DUF3575 domain-containing protein [Sesbania bispinosa]